MTAIRPDGAMTSPCARQSMPGGLVVSEGTVLASSTVAPSAFGMGERVFHIKFGYGHISGVDSNTLIVQFDKAGENKMMHAFLEKA